MLVAATVLLTTVAAGLALLAVGLAVSLTVVLMGHSYTLGSEIKLLGRVFTWSESAQ